MFHVMHLYARFFIVHFTSSFLTSFSYCLYVTKMIQHLEIDNKKLNCRLI